MSEWWYGWCSATLFQLVFWWIVLRRNDQAWKSILDRSIALSKKMLARIEHLDGRLKKKQPDDPADWWKGWTGEN